MMTAPDQDKPEVAPAEADLAARTLREAGLVVLNDVLPLDFVAGLRADYDVRLEKQIAERGGLAALDGKTFGKNQFGMHLPLLPPWSDARIVAHPRVVAVLERAIGADFVCSFYHSNTAYPGSQTQPIHRDTGHLFGPHEMSVPTPATHIVLNVPLVDFTLENGSTEVWPGSHLIVDRSPEERKEAAARAAALPSLRANVRAGSIVLRDLRLWHRGMPNQADYARPMLAIVYARGWLVQEPPLAIPQSTWDGWDERTQHIFRRNKIVPDTTNA